MPVFGGQTTYDDLQTNMSLFIQDHSNARNICVSWAIHIMKRFLSLLWTHLISLSWEMHVYIIGLFPISKHALYFVTLQ